MSTHTMIDNIALGEEYQQKLSAIKNYALTIKDFQEWSVLETVAYYCKKKGANKQAIAVLDTILDQLGIDYLDWKCRTKWVQQQIISKSEDQMCFNLPELETQRYREWSSSMIYSQVYDNQTYRIENLN